MVNHLISKIRISLIVDVILIGIISCLPLLWIPEGKILTGHDSGYPINVIEAYKNRFYTWNTQDSFGLDNTTSISVIPILSVQAAASAFGMSVPNSEKITFIFWFLAIQFSMYSFAYSLRKYVPYRWFPLLASVLYAFNFYLLALWRYGAGTTFSAYSLLPIALLFTLQVIQKTVSPLKASVYLSFSFLFLNGGGGLSLPLFGGLLISIIWATVYFLSISSQADFTELRNRILFFGIYVLLISILLNSYWLLPFLYYVITNYSTELAAKGGKAVVVMWTQSVSTFTSISNLFRLQGFPDWYDNPYHPYSNAFLSRAPLILFSMLIAPLAYISLLLAKEGMVRRIITFFAGLSLIGILFSAGTHPPTGWIYRLFMLYVPGFVIFRSAQYKFIPALLFSFAILISFTINYLLFEPKIYKNIFKRFSGLIQNVLFVLILLIILGYHFPYFRQNFFLYNKSLSTLITVPQYVLSFDEWSRKNLDTEGRTLILPKFNSSWKAGLYDWGYFSLYSPFNLITPKPFVQYSYFLNESQLPLFNRMTEELVNGSQLGNRLLSLFQIRHILLAKDIVSNDLDMPGESWEIYRNVLERFPQVWHEGKWDLRAVTSYRREKIYATNDLTRFFGKPEDSIGVILAGLDEFVLTDILGKNAKNPSFPDGTGQNTIYGIECKTCKLYRQRIEIIPQYTPILPGSMFYPLKRWREVKPSQNSITDKDLVLGLTLKRISEAIGLVSKNSNELHVRNIISEADALWKELELIFPIDVLIDQNIEDVNRIGDYAASERLHVLRAGIDYQGYKRLFDPFISRMDNILSQIEEYKNKYKYEYVYQLHTSVKNADIYLDEASLPRDSKKKAILPLSIQIGKIKSFINKQPDQGSVHLGIYAIQKNDSITLNFNKQESLLGDNVWRMVTIDNRLQQCQVSELRGFDWKRKYRLTLTDASALPTSFQLFLRKKKHFIPTFSIDDSVIKQDFAFNFDRTVKNDQDLYISGSDGDAEVYLYACADKLEQVKSIRSFIHAEEESFPTIFIKESSYQNSIHRFIPYKQINQTKYEIDVSNMQFPAFLVFNENYNMLWRLSDKDSTRSLGGIVTNWKVPNFAEKSHFQVNGYANAWYLQEKPQSNTLILEFYPQNLFYKGIILSVVGIVLIVILLIRFT